MREERVHKFDDRSVEIAQSEQKMKKDSRSYVTIPQDLTNIPIVKIKGFGKFFSHYFFKFGEIYNLKDSRSLAKPKQKQ